MMMMMCDVRDDNDNDDIDIGGNCSLFLLLSDDLLSGLREYLNPKEQCRLSSCNQRLRRILPLPLAIQIQQQQQQQQNLDDDDDDDDDNNNTSTTTVITTEWLFVSPHNNINKTLTCQDTILLLSSQQDKQKKNNNDNNNNNNDTSDEDTGGDEHNHSYYLWKYDYRRNVRVYLGRHLRQTLVSRPAFQYRYTLGYKPRQIPSTRFVSSETPYWKFMSTKTETGPTTTTTCSALEWGQNVELILCGSDDTRPRVTNWLQQQQQQQQQPLLRLCTMETITATSRQQQNQRRLQRRQQQQQQQRTDETFQDNEEEEEERLKRSLFIIQSDEGDDEEDENNGNNNNNNTNNQDEQQQQQQRKKACTEFQIWDSYSLLFKESTTKTTTTITTTTSSWASFTSSSSSPSPSICRNAASSSSSSTSANDDNMVYTQQQRICTHEVPEICDKGAYFVFSPQQWQREAENLLSETMKTTTTATTATTTTRGTTTASPSPTTAITDSSSEDGDTGMEVDDDGDDDVGTTTMTALQSDNIMARYGDGRCAFVEFYFWISGGYLYLRSPVLPFSLGIPITMSDRKYFRPQLGPIANLYESYSARWGCIKYYMATAADVGEGCPLNMTVFRRRVAEHDEHRVVVLENIVSIHMHEEVDMDIPDIPKDENQMWRFFFSG